MHPFALKLAAFGWLLLEIDLTIFALTIISLVVYAMRHGKNDETLGQVITTSQVPLNLDMALTGCSKQKVLVSRSMNVSMESLVNGTASRSDWVFATGITAALICFALIFPSVALINLPSRPALLLFMAVPFVFLYPIAKAMYKDYRDAMTKRKARATDASPVA